MVIAGFYGLGLGCRYAAIREGSAEDKFICKKINYINDLHEIYPNSTAQGKYLLVYMAAPGICIHRMHGLRKI